MAGINLGPFREIQLSWAGGSTGELFEFGKPSSQVSKDYEAALDKALRFGVRVLYCGSIDDQLVSMEVGFSPPARTWLQMALEYGRAGNGRLADTCPVINIWDS
jgi:hypothetical protein